jgi:hypothetical protein
MYEAEPMLDHDCRAWLGRKLRADFDLRPDSTMSPRLQALMAELTAGEEESASLDKLNVPTWLPPSSGSDAGVLNLTA